ncbi:MAG: hypothetical protein V4736_12855, partial [Bdellovibrionota bacterium]
VNRMNSCISTCNSAADKLRTCLFDQGQDSATVSSAVDPYISSLERCESYAAAAKAAEETTRQTVATAANAANCADETDGTGGVPPSYCIANPTAPACKKQNLAQACDNPEFAATNLTCQCLKNPNAEGCSALSKGGGVVAGPNSGLLSSTSGAGTSDISDLIGGDENDLAAIESKGSSDSEVSGKQGGSANLGGGGAGGLGGGRGGGGAGEKKSFKDILAGFFGGGGGGTGGGGPGSKGGGGSGNGSGPGGGAAAGGPDLKKFMPGGFNDPRRGIASTTGKDGLNGRHADLFGIVKHGYYKQLKTFND